MTEPVRPLEALIDEVGKLCCWWLLNREGATNRAYDYIDKAVKKFDALLQAAAPPAPTADKGIEMRRAERQLRGAIARVQGFADRQAVLRELEAYLRAAPPERVSEGKELDTQLSEMQFRLRDGDTEHERWSRIIADARNELAARPAVEPR